MSLRKPPKSTPQLIAASRENAKKSNGPVTAQGKANVSLNALQHGRYSSASARTFRDTLMALGEAPEEFDRLYEELLAPYEPAHPLLTSEIKTLAKLYWDYERWERARDGLLRREMELLDLDQLKMKQALERQTFDASQHEVFSQGLRRADDSPAKFKQILSYLGKLLDLVERRQFSEDNQMLFRALYGESPTWRGGRIAELYDVFHCPGMHNEKADEKAYQELQQLLGEEMRSVREEYDLYQREHVKITAAQRDARLAPTDQRWTWVQRQGNGLLRAIDRSVKTVIRLAQLYPPQDRPKGTPGTPGGDPGRRAVREATPTGALARASETRRLQPRQKSPRFQLHNGAIKSSPPSRSVATCRWGGQFQVTLNWRNKPGMLLKTKDR